MPDIQTARAQKLLAGRLREIIGHCNVAGLGAALVTDSGNRVLTSAVGRRGSCWRSCWHGREFG